jgi:hypothetical protein
MSEVRTRKGDYLLPIVPAELVRLAHAGPSVANELKSGEWIDLVLYRGSIRGVLADWWYSPKYQAVVCGRRDYNRLLSRERDEGRYSNPST